MTAGILVWAYTLLLPSFADADLVGKDILSSARSASRGCARSICSASTCRRWCMACCGASTLNIFAYVTSSLARAPTSIERLQANLFVPSELAPMTPSFRLWRSSVTVEELTTTVARYLGEERTRFVVRQLRGEPPHQPRPEAGGGHPSAALRRAHPRLGDRRGILAARALAAAAQAHGLDQGRAQAARRCQCGDPVQPRNPADRARSRAPGHRGVRQGPAARLLEPAVRRNPRPAAVAHPRRHRARRDPAPQRRAAARSGRAASTISCTSASRATSRAPSRSASASPSADW